MTISPMFFVFYILIMIMATILSAEISNAYQIIIADPTLSATFATMPIQNFILNNFVLFIVIIGFVGAIIMFVNMKKREYL